MEIINTIKEMQQKALEWQKANYSIGFIPTMGYLHEGHCSLIKNAKQKNDKVIVSIFVNPTQFSKSEDLSNYPRDIVTDTNLCKSFGVDIIFYPTAEDMYTSNFFTSVSVPNLSNTMCGKSRPTHFNGVCLIVCKLLNIIRPTNTYFGLKDYQQVTIVKTMVKDLNIQTNIVACETLREKNGLAMSSRNAYLSEKEKEKAIIIYNSLIEGNKIILKGEKNASTVINKITQLIKSEPLAEIDYIQIVDAETLEDLTTIDRPLVIACAIYIGNTRLIDNIITSL